MVLNPDGTLDSPEEHLKHTGPGRDILIPVVPGGAQVLSFGEASRCSTKPGLRTQVEELPHSLLAANVWG